MPITFSALRRKTFGDKNAPQYLIVGLGNPGLAYEKTRHNAGFMAVTRLAKELGISINKVKFEGLYGMGEVSGQKCLLLLPQTFMNNSGRSVSAFAKFYQIPPQNIIVCFDDISLPPGALRIRRKGSHGGHNGAKDICALLGSDDWQRIKLGVGAKPHPDYDLAKWVLSKFAEPEQKELERACQNAADALKLMVAGETDRAMNLYNS